MDHFDTIQLEMKWNFLGVPNPKSWSLMRQPGTLWLLGNANRLDDGMGVAWVGCRQEHFNCEVIALLSFSPEVDGDEAGLTVWKDARHHYDLFVSKENGKRFVSVRRRIGSLAAVVMQQEISEGPITLLVRANRLLYSFAFLAEDGSERPLSMGETRYLSSEVAGGFTGVYFAMYASGNGRNSSNPAYFDWFDHRVNEQGDVLSVDSSVSQLLSAKKTREVLAKHLPELVAHPPAEWGANLSLLDLSAMSPEEIPPDKLPGIDADLRRACVSTQGL
jgi:alpha-N-arabinofuranosidase